jgi:DUF1365 family protein
MTSCLYVGEVMHRRLLPFGHRFVYRVFSLLLDLDELPMLDRRLRLFAYNRAGLFSFHNSDHGPRDGSALRPWVERLVAAHGIEEPCGRIRVLCFPRLFGHVFNPLTVYFCESRAGRLIAMLYEVKNTFGEQHAYLLPVSDDHTPGALIRQRTPKAFHVSPFIPMACVYDFRLREPDDHLALAIRQGTVDGRLLIATQTGRRRELNDGTLARLFLTHPLLTLKVVAAIHWEALRLWLKGAPFFAKPTVPDRAVTMAREGAE